MNRKEARALLHRSNNGLVVDGYHKIPWDLSTKGLVVAAPTGAGKTTNFLIPQLLRLTGHSVICTDPSGEIQEKTQGYLRSIGYEIETLNLMDARSSATYCLKH
ncbi:MAG: type IV secretory system conjugative DNA transfer family protein, partial [Bacteroidota bacterium]